MPLKATDTIFLHDFWEKLKRGEKLKLYRLNIDNLALRRIYLYFLDKMGKSGVEPTSSRPPYWDNIWDKVFEDKTLTEHEYYSRIDEAVKVFMKLEPEEKTVESEILRYESETLKSLEEVFKNLSQQARLKAAALLSEDIKRRLDEAEKAIAEKENLITRLREEQEKRRLSEEELERVVKELRELKDTMALLKRKLEAGAAQPSTPTERAGKPELIEEAKRLWATYRTAILVNDITLAETTLKRLREIRYALK